MNVAPIHDAERQLNRCGPDQDTQPAGGKTQPVGQRQSFRRKPDGIDFVRCYRTGAGAEGYQPALLILSLQPSASFVVGERGKGDHVQGPEKAEQTPQYDDNDE